MTALTAIKYHSTKADGSDNSGGRVWTYAAGTTTPQPTYTTPALSTPNTNPVILDSTGRAAIYLDSALAYKFVVTDADGVAMPEGTVDNWTPSGTAGSAVFASEPRSIAAPGATSLALTLATFVPGVGAVRVIVNGLEWRSGIDFTEAAGNVLQWASPMLGGEEIDVFTGRFVTAGLSADALEFTAGASRSVAEVLRETVRATDYGADPTGSASSSAAILAAIAALPNGGTVIFPAGAFALGSEVAVPPYVNLWGAGLGATVFRSTHANGRLNFIRGSADGRGGLSGNFSIDGNDIGTSLLTLGVVVERNFQSIDVHGSYSNGIVVNGAQNCGFFGVAAQNNRGTNWIWDYGAGNNRLYSCEISQGGTWNVRFQQSGASPSGAFDVPSGNRMIGGIVERLGWDGDFASPDTATGSIYHGAGRYNGFHQMDIAVQGATAAKSIVLVEKASPSYDSTLLEFSDVLWSGSATYTTAIEARASTSLHITGRQTFENHATAFMLADTARVYGMFNPTTGGVTTYFANQGGGSQPQQNLIVAEVRQRFAFQVPAGFVAQSIRADANTFASNEQFPGYALYGDGAAAANVKAGFIEKYGIDGMQAVNTAGGTSFVFSMGPIDLVITNGVPSAAAPNGSIAINTTGTSTTTFYIRAAGAWVAK